MSQHQVSQKNLNDLIRESHREEEKYLKGLFAKILVDDPLCAVMIRCLADNARAQLVRDGNMPPLELYQLVVDACVFVLRLRDLAERDNTQPKLDKTLMEDPDTTKTSALDAQEEMLMLVEIMRMGSGRKST